MLSKQAERRLTKLVNFMASLPRSANQHFDMSSWFVVMEHEPDEHGLHTGRAVTSRDLSLCGTSACALGWAATMPSFKRAGLSMDSVMATPNFKGRHYGLEAAKAFFDIDLLQAHNLFAGVNKDRTPKQWARRARKLIRRWKKEAE